MTNTKSDFPSKEEWEASQADARRQQNIDNLNHVPEQRPQGTIAPDPVQGEIAKRLSEEGSNMAHDAPAHGYEEHKRAHDNAKKTPKPGLVERLYPGAYCVIDNPDGKGKEHNGRPVAVNGVEEWKSAADAVIAAAGGPEARFAKVKTYRCAARDGRAEPVLIVSAEHLKRVGVGDFHRGLT